MLKTTEKTEMNYLLEIAEKDSSNDWEDLCTKCSSIVKEANMTDDEIDEIVKKYKKG